METEGKSEKFRVIEGGRRLPKPEDQQQVVTELSEELAAGVSQRRKGIIKLASTIGRLLRFDVIGKKSKTSGQFPKK